MKRILFLGVSNSVRSIMAEAYLRSKCGGRFMVGSAGSMPEDVVNPRTKSVLESARIATNDLWTKDWIEVVTAQNNHFDYVITVCDRAQDFLCDMPPVLAGNPIVVHWSTIDPSDPANGELDRVFELAFRQLCSRIDRFLTIDQDADRHSREKAVKAIALL